MKAFPHHRGQLLLLATITVAVLGIFVLALQTTLVTTSKTAGIVTRQRITRNLAEAGIAHARWKLNTDMNYAGETLSFGGGEIALTVTTVNPSTRMIEAAAFYPTQTNPRAQKTIRATVVINATTIAFNYGVQVDRGGLSLQENAGINGNLYANGSVMGSNNAFIDGTVFVATGITQDVSHEQHLGEHLFGQTNPNVDVGMSFRPNTSGPVSQIALKLKKNHSQNPNATMRILGDLGGAPDKNAVLATGSLNASLVSTDSFDWISIATTPSGNVTANQTYWIVFDASQDNNKYWYWAKDQNEGYGNGVAKYTTNWNAASPVWTQITGDMDFRIFIGGSVTTIDNVDIEGDAHANSIFNATITDGDAYYQTIANTTVRGAACPNAACHPGSTDPPLQNLPISDANIADWEADALDGGTDGCSGTLTLTGSVTIGPKKYPCDVVVALGSIVTIAGTVWIQGDLTIQNDATIRLDQGYGARSGIVIVDDPADQTGNGTLTVNNNVTMTGSGTAGSYLMFLSTRSGATDAITINNNVSGAIFYANHGTISVANNAQLKEATGYRLVLANNAVVTYESGLASTIFTQGPGGSWQISPGTWQEL